MGNDTLRTELNNLERKVKILISEHARLKQDMEFVKKENEELKANIDEKAASLSNFQNQGKISKIVESMVVGNGDQAEMKEAIDDYIKEIDKCIAQLSES